MGSGRLGPTASAVLGLIGTVIGGFALTRARGAVAGSSSSITAIVDRRGSAAALVLGAISLVLGARFLTTADGGPGTGNGVVGSAAALIFGLSAVVLGGLARTRARNVGTV